MASFNPFHRLLLLLPILLATGRLPATVVLPQNIEQLESQAQLIFAGVCASRTAEVAAPGIPATVFAFRVIEGVKGNLKAGSEIRVRQFGGQMPGQPIAMKMPGVPNYAVGQEVVLFLNPPSSIGLTAPVGLTQGVFAIERTRDGKRRIGLDPLRRSHWKKNLDAAKYARSRRLTTAERRMLSDPPAQMELAEFCALIRKIKEDREEAERN